MKVPRHDWPDNKVAHMAWYIAGGVCPLATTEGLRPLTSSSV